MKKTERKTRPATGRRKSTRSPEGEASLARDAGSSGKDEIAKLIEHAHKEIKALIELVAEKQITEFELERGDFRLRIHRGVTNSAPEISYAAPPQVILRPAPPQAAAGAATVAASAPAAEPAGHVPAPTPAEENLHVITSPIVGTFYRAASPAAAAFVKIGDEIEKGQTLCIIEAMKLMNEITAEVSGTVAKIFAENGQPVEYGQPLFGIRL
ncbi:MAG TPA: acetyl-CoA carboxylase biotin carboxyl carrier protein [Blastocatellia bacterium]|nr:acetyl-CoA carboxylase biotin carboxyl carrier protein [Blastocatellia bacterium]